MADSPFSKESPDRCATSSVILNYANPGLNPPSSLSTIADMTDPCAERIYHRLFTPGMGSSSDEL